METRVLPNQDSALRFALKSAGDRSRAAQRQMQIVLDGFSENLTLDEKNLQSCLILVQQHFEDAALLLSLSETMIGSHRASMPCQPLSLRGAA